jgi:hypothetical protein
MRAHAEIIDADAFRVIAGSARSPAPIITLMHDVGGLSCAPACQPFHASGWRGVVNVTTCTQCCMRRCCMSFVGSPL